MHRDLESTNNACDLQGDTEGAMLAIIPILSVFTVAIGPAIVFRRRFTVKLINQLAMAASAITQGNFSYQVAAPARTKPGSCRRSSLKW